MAIKICDIEKHSPACRKGILPGDFLVSINGHEIIDVLDFRFHQVNSNVTLTIQRDDGTINNIEINKGEYEELGLLFDSYLIDKEKRCKNKCIFCFIDQLPKGMREPLYFKDDDSRLSFLFGNYVTLTNLTQHDVDRIISMHISPINVSVHTTNEELRVKMMGNKHAGESLKFLYELAKNGIKINCQLVMCRGINDGDELTRTLTKLMDFGDSIECVALVPVGITKFRDNLYPLLPYDKNSACEIIDTVSRFQDEFKSRYGRRTVFASDEFYLKAEIPIPDVSFYEDLNQLENGVGMLALLRDEFLDALKDVPQQNRARHITIACGAAAFPLLYMLSKKLMDKILGIRVEVIQIKNDFFGEEITVSGLITGRDLINTLKDIDLGEELLITSSMLNHDGDMFLDDITLEEVKHALGVEVTPIDSDGYLLVEHIIGESM